MGKKRKADAEHLEHLEREDGIMDEDGSKQAEVSREDEKFMVRKTMQFLKTKTQKGWWKLRSWQCRGESRGGTSGEREWRHNLRNMIWILSMCLKVEGEEMGYHVKTLEMFQFVWLEEAMSNP